jgi:2,4-dienoyl-CoA reductase-like NADH-dependent reductase (Old Yellow Enzyme family)
MKNQLIAQDFALPCGVRLKNRIAKAAMSENMSTPDHKANTAFETTLHALVKWRGRTFDHGQRDD